VNISKKKPSGGRLKTRCAKSHKTKKRKGELEKGLGEKHKSRGRIAGGGGRP